MRTEKRDQWGPLFADTWHYLKEALKLQVFYETRRTHFQQALAYLRGDRAMDLGSWMPKAPVINPTQLDEIFNIVQDGLNHSPVVNLRFGYTRNGDAKTLQATIWRYHNDGYLFQRSSTKFRHGQDSFLAVLNDQLLYQQGLQSATLVVHPYQVGENSYQFNIADLAIALAECLPTGDRYDTLLRDWFMGMYAGSVASYALNPLVLPKPGYPNDMQILLRMAGQPRFTQGNEKLWQDNWVMEGIAIPQTLTICAKQPPTLTFNVEGAYGGMVDALWHREVITAQTLRDRFACELLGLGHGND